MIRRLTRPRCCTAALPTADPDFPEDSFKSQIAQRPKSRNEFAAGGLAPRMQALTKGDQPKPMIPRRGGAPDRHASRSGARYRRNALIVTCTNLTRRLLQHLAGL